jgi:hypothetical protein
MNRKVDLRKMPSSCPQCNIRIKRTEANLAKHFDKVHSRAPTGGEISQFINFKFELTPYSDGEFSKPKNEVSGGGVSPK